MSEVVVKEIAVNRPWWRRLAWDNLDEKTLNQEMKKAALRRGRLLEK